MTDRERLRDYIKQARLKSSGLQDEDWEIAGDLIAAGAVFPKPEDREAALQEACDLFNEPWDTNTIIPRVAAALAAARAPLQKRVDAAEAALERARAALTECAAPHIIGNNKDGINWEGLAREFNRRQGIAADAIGQPRAALQAPPCT